MSNQICDALNLPRMDELFAEVDEVEAVDAELLDGDEGEPTEPADEPVEETAIQHIDGTGSTSLQHLERLEGVEEHTNEMNEIYDEAMKSYRDLIDLAMNMEAGRAGSIAETAVSMLKTALDASKSKSDQRLKRLRFRLDKEKLERSAKVEATNVVEAGQPDDNGATMVANRNDLLKMFANRRNSDK
jgi:hypothetical protein